MTARRVSVDLGELEMAFEDSTGGARYFLDLETGAVVAITDDVRSELNAIERKHGGLDTVTAETFAEELKQHDIPEWMLPMVQEAFAVEQDDSARYLGFPEAGASEDYRTMEDFIGTVSNQRLQAQLAHAIQGRGAFRRFKDALLDHQEERERWFAFRTERLRERVVMWLREEGIEPIFE
jgi:hypothetical protein